MVVQSVFIPVLFPGLNEYGAAERTNKFAGAKMKKEYTDLAAWYIRSAKLQPYTTPVIISFHWFEPSTRRDPDNIIFAKKFILDGLVAAGVIPNDNQKWIRGFNAERWNAVTDKKRVGVELTIREGVVADGSPK